MNDETKTWIAGAASAALVLLTLLWARAVWRVFLRNDHRRDTFDDFLVQRNHVVFGGMALICIWLPLLLPVIRLRVGGR